MEELTIVKISDLKELIQEIKTVKDEVRLLRDQEDLKAYSLEQTAKLINLSYSSVRKLVRQKKLHPKYLNEKNECGKCTIPAWSIKQYLLDKNSKTIEEL
ncbi:hypothetical protein JYT36_00165 [Bacteroidales bacterium AH-315-N07]|nr:hypothetical protein [Bacteroidales bacterium AH-315-N07]